MAKTMETVMMEIKMEKKMETTIMEKQNGQEHVKLYRSAAWKFGALGFGRRVQRTSSSSPL